MIKEMKLFDIKADEFKAVWEALAQWADNERNHIEESSDDGFVNIADFSRLAIVDAVVFRMEAAICATIEECPCTTSKHPGDCRRSCCKEAYADRVPCGCEHAKLRRQRVQD